MRGGLGVLVIYPNGSTAVRTVYGGAPKVGQELILRRGWVVASVSVRNDEVDGQPVAYEVHVVRP